MRPMRTPAILLVAFMLLSLGCATTSNRMETAAQESRFRLKYKMGLSYIQSGRFKEALLELLEAQKIGPSTPELYNSLGIAYLGLGEMDKAKTAFKKAVALKPDYSEAHTNLATLYIQKKEWKRAIKECNEALKNPLYLTPESAYNNRGYAHQMLGEDQKALADYYKALRYNTTFTKAYENLISFYLVKEDLPNARGTLNDAEALGLTSPGLIFYKALFKHIDGDEANAWELFNQVVREYPLSVWAQKARSYLNLIGSPKVGGTIPR